MASEQLRGLTNREFLRLLNKAFLGSSTSELHDHGVYSSSRRRKLLKHHPDKDPEGTQKTQYYNALWSEYCKRFREDLMDTGSSGSGSPGTPEFNQSWDPLIAAHFMNAMPASYVSVFVFLAPYPCCVGIKRAVQDLKVADMFMGKMASGLGMLGVHLQYRSTLSGMTQRVYKVTKSFHLGCVWPRRWSQLKSDCLSLFPDGFTFGTPDPTPHAEEFSLVMLEKFALDMEITDPVYLQGVYQHEFTVPLTECTLCAEDDKQRPDLATHKPHHVAHHANALAFAKLKEKRKAAAHAADSVQAFLRLQGKRLPPANFYAKRLKELLEPLAKGGGPAKPLAARAVLFKHIVPGDFEQFLETVYDAIVIGEPKKRGLIFRGPFDCGKTTVAQSIRGFFLGASLNVNLSKDRLHFELGGALDQRLVVFDDVLGNSDRRELNNGWGFKNLDQLRDHLDGCIPVGLERKHHNRVEQVFPPWIITCNEYTIPDSIKARGKVIEFSKNLNDPDNFMFRYCFSRSELCSGHTFALTQAIFIPTDSFPESVRPLVDMLKEDTKEFIEEMERDLLDLSCREEMPLEEEMDPNFDVNTDPISRFKQFISSLSTQGSSMGSEESGFGSLPS
ncbi:TPA: large T antigen [Pomona leaf-nosed bat associated polyomavirus]|uniref:large T antigen n=1 Tax=Pomona leaf-nosed bat associated polyomavirus TaxID=1885565 RepID=UPI000958D135|nr:large T antigen [Pomona leaf-nosed bat associated polyomavirus]SCC98885.1 TPA: large T antigen [Pomona leaf-nosed bat associated polyomavirus]